MFSSLWTFFGIHLLPTVSGSPAVAPRNDSAPASHHKVLILGGGVSGVIAARTLHEQGVDDFLILEARDQLGGRLASHPFGGKVIESGANWIQGTQVDGGPANPIFTLARKHGLQTQPNDFFGSITTYDVDGATDYIDIFNDAVDAYADLTDAGGPRVAKSLVDLTSRAGYSIIRANARTPQEQAAEYFQFDWEYGQTPEQTSWTASSWANNFTFVPEAGGFSGDNLLSVDQRGFKFFIQAEAEEFLRPQQVRYNSTVKSIAYSDSQVAVTLDDGQTFTGDYAISTFSVGVLQNDDVKFEPEIPDFKWEAISSMTMAIYTKIFLQFKENFWFDTEFGLYADPERGRYPVWQSLDHESFFPGSGIIFVTVTGDYSERVERLSDSQVKEEALEVLRTMFPNVTIPEPVDFFFPRWFSDPLFRGSYSNWPTSFFSEHHDNLRANLGRLYFSGEAMSQKYFGFLQGAYDEGQKIGTLVAQCVRGDVCVQLKSVEDVTNAHPYEI
ncbi:amine oxidase [Marasmius fiardii PR-910]|nr:amine oxidase [Marasmius fiardii PR-910]